MWAISPSPGVSLTVILQFHYLNQTSKGDIKLHHTHYTHPVLITPHKYPTNSQTHYTYTPYTHTDMCTHILLYTNTLHVNTDIHANTTNTPTHTLYIRTCMHALTHARTHSSTNVRMHVYTTQNTVQHMILHTFIHYTLTFVESALVTAVIVCGSAIASTGKKRWHLAIS